MKTKKYKNKKDEIGFFAHKIQTLFMFTLLPLDRTPCGTKNNDDAFVSLFVCPFISFARILFVCLLFYC